jgi:hypothetical protein
MDGFIYQQVSPSAVSDLMNMSKEVYELHDDNSESLVENGIVNESSTYGIEVGFLDDLESKAMFLGINKGLGLPSQSDEPVQLVTIYYNDVFVSEVPNEIYANCPYVNVPIDEAIDYADNKIENREWDSYCIPELCNHEVKFTEVLYQRDDFDAMLDTLGVAMDEFIQLHNHARIDGMDTYYENHIIQLNQIISFVTESKLNQQ